MEFKNLIIEKRDDHIAIVTLNRPAKLNTLNSTLMREIERVTEEFHTDLETRVVIFTGAGKHFCAGVDLTEPQPQTTLLGSQRARQIGPRMFHKLQSIEQITIAAINGGAFGGGACIAAALDFRIGEENCYAGFPESRLGMSLSWNALPLVVHLIGPTYAKEMVILGKNNDAKTLLKWAFLSEVVPKDKLSRINGFNFLLTGVIHIIGPIIGATLLIFLTVELALWIDIITYLIAIVPLLLIKIPSFHKETEDKKRESMWKEFKSGFKILTTIPGLLVLILEATIFNFLVQPISTLFPYYIRVIHNFLGPNTDCSLND